MIISIKDVWPERTIDAHRNYVFSLFDVEAAKKRPWGAKYLEDFIDRNRLALATGSPAQLRGCIDDYRAMIASRPIKSRRNIDEELSRVLSYRRFSDKDRAGWNAFELCRSARYVMCPYCQQALSITVFRDNGRGAYRPTLDHFYPKHLFPCLSLSLYNLIPSCQSCNSSLKGSADFYSSRHLHPYEDDESISFDLDIEKYVQEKFLGAKVWGVKIRPGAGFGVKNSISTFAIAERYGMVSELARRFAKGVYLKYSVSHEKYREIFRDVGFDFEESDFIEFNISNYKNEFLGKLKLDVHNRISGYIGR